MTSLNTSHATDISPQEAAQELLLRRKARRRLIDFATFVDPTYKVDLGHQVIASALDRVVEGECKRLILLAPPQHGKSRLVSEMLPAFWLGRHPDAPVILCSYAADLAHGKGRAARDIVEGSDFQALFPGVETRSDSRAVGKWDLVRRRGGMLSAGVGGPITGHGAQLGIIDDPVANYAQACSEVYQAHALEWYRNTFRTRVWEAGAIIIVMTRWHEADLVGLLLEAGAAGWEVLRLPALAETQEERDELAEKLGLPLGQPDPAGREPGEPLCPTRFSREDLENRRDAPDGVGPTAWEAQYQGRPRKTGGNLFKRAWFKILQAAPSRDQIQALCRYWDKAATEGGGDHTAGVLVARLRDGRYAILDVVRGQWSPGTREATILQTAQLDAITYGPQAVQIVLEQEGGSAGKSDAQASIKALAGHRVAAEHPTGSKEIRAQPLANQAEAGNVDLVAGPWNKDFLDEMEAFPQGKHDDQVDAASGAFNRVALAAGRPRVIAL